MSISHALSNALTGLTAASRRAEVVSSNLANVMTDGYGRRTLELSAHQLGGVGAGVRIDGVQRIVDRGILADRRLADAGLAGHRDMTRMLGRLEAIVGTEGSGATLSDKIARLEEALVSASSDPASDIRLDSVRRRMGEVATALNDSADGVQTLRQEADASIATQVETLNTSLAQVEQLNSDISRLLISGDDPSGLMDQRQRVIDQIAGIVPTREVARPNGQVALYTPAGGTLIDGPAPTFEFQQVNTITADMTMASGGLFGLGVRGAPVDPANGIGPFDGGSLGAAFAMRDKTLVEVQSNLDAVARDLVERFQDAGADPTLLAGDAGLFTDGGGAFDPLDTDGLSARIAVNAAIDPSSGGALFRIRDGLGAATPGLAGDSTQINRLIDALSDMRPTHLGGAADGAAGHAARLVANLGNTRVAADDQLSFAQARQDTIRQAELAGGVDSDAELQNLMLIEQAFAANARLIQTVDTLMQQMLEI